MDNVGFKNNLKSLNIQYQLEKNLIDKISNSLSNLQLLQTDNELLLYICNCIESGISNNKKKKINKKELCIKIMETIFNNLSDEEKDRLRNTIDFFHANKLIYKLATSETLKKEVYKWVVKKCF
jgi:translation initiation factor 2B subunit (eIF-2B alpha/beta/delta family)